MQRFTLNVFRRLLVFRFLKFRRHTAPIPTTLGVFTTGRVHFQPQLRKRGEIYR